MGMYDNLIINTAKLPISEEEKIMIGKDPGWQTKSLDCNLTEIYITDEGELKVNNWAYEAVPKKDRPHPKATGLLGMAGSLRRVNERTETLNFTGVINFYTSTKDGWYEFDAHFLDGKLTEIKGGKEIL